MFYSEYTMVTYKLFSAFVERTAVGAGAAPVVLAGALELRTPGMRQTLQGSFSAVSKPNFARKYALESSSRDLHDALLCTVLNALFFQKSLKFC